ncbi:telomerase Cajal body protein 1 homolog isoform X1 [Musca domestica]|uniref:WD repeat-containing protein 79 n=1 Tax=Musca domestica TaxID=7370 RepID=A0A9J7D7X9_MUSDO|nr:telomerase Cajal body protein 1 homolog isoform X1 [Musca domestica]
MDDSSQLIVTEQSSLSMSMEEESSILNNNGKFSQLELSLPIVDETVTEENNTSSVGGIKLSITMDEDEKNMLSKQKGRNIRSDTLLENICYGTSKDKSNTKQTADPKVQSKSMADDITMEEGEEDGSITRTITETVNATEKSQLEELNDTEEKEDEEDDSVIPVDEDDDEEGEDCEESTLQNSNLEASNATVANKMFQHLQPQEKSIAKEASVDLEESMETENVEQSVDIPQDSYIETEDSSQLLPDENGFFKYPLVELGRRLWPSTEQKQCYTKGCLWSPDGTCLLVPVHMDGMHVLELPTDLYTTQELNAKRELSPLNTAVHVKEGGMVYDCCWYPFMASTDPATCCWLATRQHEPIHMWDAFTGELRCSYRGYDDVDEVESAIAVAFSNDGQKIVGGYKKNIKIFDTNVPGRDYTSVPVKQTVSCFAFNQENDNCVTTGSWNSHIYHYDLRAPKLGPLFVLGGHTGGVTWLKYSSYNTDNWYLFSGARKDNKILQWDMRNYQEPVKSYERTVKTNQRIYFDLSPLEKWLISGDTEGCLRIWDMDDREELMEIPLHFDCCNGVSFHPTLPIISTSSGQYHFTDTNLESDKIEENSAGQKIVDYENSVVFLWFGTSSNVD